MGSVKKGWRRQTGNDQEVKSLALALTGHMREWREGFQDAW